MKCPDQDIFGLPCRLHQSQIPNVLPDLRCIASRIGDDVPPECGHHGSMAINLEDAAAVALYGQNRF